MQIIVCLKPMVKTDTPRIKIAADGRKIDMDGIKFDCGPYDLRAISRAVKLKASVPGSTLIAIAAGAADGERDAKKRLKDALALLCDKAVFIPDPEPEHRDPLSVAKALAEAIKAQGKTDLVFFGRQSVDLQNLAVGPMTAVLLGWPCVTDAVGIEVSGATATVTRAAEGRTETIELKLPAVITAQRDLGEEQYAKLKDILAAGKKTIETFNYTWPATTWEVKKLVPPPARQAGKIVGEGPDAAPKLLDLLQNEAKALTL
jgi:electron transfer flavoprotein beta subunit